MKRFDLEENQAGAARLTADAGLSLVEILFSVGFAAILILATTPVFSQILHAYNLRGAARAVFADLQKARMQAVMENHNLRFIVVNSQTYEIHDDTNNNGVVDAGETVTLQSIQTDSPSVQLTTTSTIITFAANGTAPTYGTITVHTTLDATQTVNVVVTSAGRVRTELPTS